MGMGTTPSAPLLPGAHAGGGGGVRTACSGSAAAAGPSLCPADSHKLARGSEASAASTATTGGSSAVGGGDSHSASAARSRSVSCEARGLGRCVVGGLSCACSSAICTRSSRLARARRSAAFCAAPLSAYGSEPRSTSHLACSWW
eukprot:scaffold64733_cov62-Phaeocystis_antarctica.AAC.5